MVTRSSSLFLCVVSALTLLYAGPSHAADVTPEGAAKLKTLIDAQLQARKNIQKAAGAEEIQTGDVVVESKGSYYAVTFPHIVTKYSGGIAYDMGKLALNAIPGATDKEWKVSFAVPSPLYMKDDKGNVLWQIDLGPQRANGIWNTDMMSFTRLNASYQNIHYKILNALIPPPADLANGGGAAAPAAQAPTSIDTVIGSVTIDSNLQPGANGNLSGPGTVTMSDIVTTESSTKGQMKIGQIKADYSISDLDPMAMKKFTEQVSAIGEGGQTITSSATSGAGALSLYNLITDLIGKSTDAFSMKTSINSVSLIEPGKAPGLTESFSLGSAGVEFSMSGFRSGLVKTGFQFSYGDLKLPSVPADLSPYIPSTVSLGMNMHNLPFAQLVDMGRQSITANTTGNAEAINIQLRALPQLLAASGTTIDHTFNLDAPALKARGNGMLVANAKAPDGFTADQSAEIEGLDAAITTLNQKMKDPTNPQMGALQNAAQSLTVLQMIGQQKPDNPNIRTYKLIRDESGKMTMNGADWGTLMGGAASGQPAPSK